MDKIYLIKSFPVNITNILHAVLTRNAGDRLVGSCTYELDKKFLEANYNELVNMFGVNIRDIDWKENVDRLQEFVSNHISKGIMIFGTYSDDQIDFLKDAMKNNIITIGLNYTIDYYELLLDNMVDYHCYKNGGDKKKLKVQFDQQNLCPMQSDSNFDYNINLADLFDKTKIVDHCYNINLPFTDDTSKFYDSWLDLNKY